MLDPLTPPGHEPERPVTPDERAREWLMARLKERGVTCADFLDEGSSYELFEAIIVDLAAYAAHCSADAQALGCRACGSHVEIREGLVDGCAACLKSSLAAAQQARAEAFGEAEEIFKAQVGTAERNRNLTQFFWNDCVGYALATLRARAKEPR